MSVGNGIRYADQVIRVGEEDFSSMLICPIEADESNSKEMEVMAEFFCRANYGLKNGCFELDYDDGEIRYRSFVDCGGQIPTKAVIRRSICVPTAMLHRYAPGILDIVFGGSEDAEAEVEKCEGEILGDVSRKLKEVGGELMRMLRKGKRSSKSESKNSGESEVDIPSFEEFLSMLSDDDLGEDDDSDAESYGEVIDITDCDDEAVG